MFRFITNRREAKQYRKLVASLQGLVEAIATDIAGKLETRKNVNEIETVLSEEDVVRLNLEDGWSHKLTSLEHLVKVELISLTDATIIVNSVDVTHEVVPYAERNKTPTWRVVARVERTVRPTPAS